jgi:hypothetical protein
MITKIKVSPLRLDKNGKTFIYTFLELESSSRLPGRDQKVNEMTIKPHIRGVFCLWDDG